MLTLPIVARFSQTAFLAYLEIINRIWGAAFQVGAFAPVMERQRPIYYVLLAGERRYRACMLLWGLGCEKCQKKASRPLRPGQCYCKHFGTNQWEVRLCDDIPPVHALYIQLAENTHNRVPEHQEAWAYYQLYNLLRSANEGFTVAAFARRVGRSPDTIRRALRYCELPASVKSAVEQGLIRYGIALELVKLQQLGMDEDMIGWWMRLAIAHPYLVPEFRKLVDAHVFNRLHGQQELFQIMTAEQEILARRQAVRRVVEQNTINAIWLWVHYLERVLQLLEGGLLGIQESPFSKRSPRKVLRRMIDLQQRILDHSVKLLPASEAETASVVLAKLIELEPRLDAAGVLED
ncbi:MAG: hypothetical protein WC734_04925 [Patescibacteria group bacterium]